MQAVLMYDQHLYHSSKEARKAEELYVALVSDDLQTCEIKTLLETLVMCTASVMAVGVEIVQEPTHES